MNRFKLKQLLVLPILLAAMMLKAGEDIAVSSPLVNQTITSGAFVEKSGSRYTDNSTTYSTERAYGLIKLSAPDLYTCAACTGSFAVTVAIDYKVKENGAYVSYSVNQTLTLSTGADKVVDAAYYKAEGAEYIKATVTGITPSTIPTGWPDIKLEASVYTKSFNFLDYDAVASIGLTHQTSLTTDGNLVVNWNSLPAAEAYQLEWTYVSDQGAKTYVDKAAQAELPTNQIPIDRFLFRTNSSRIEVKGTSYQIPMVYEKGYILYRIKAIGKRVVNGVVAPAETGWTAPDGIYSTVAQFPSANRFKFNGLEKNLNWQSSITFAEEGKHKAAISYYDGSMRNRQAVTRINTDQRSVVGETFYDYNGKPVIQVLPVPVPENALTYYPNFNLIQGETVIQKQDYSVMNQGEGCVAVSPNFDTATGASQYYSTNNSFQNSTTYNTGNQMLNRDLIPDAEKKPYTQTKYTNDNTGRVAAQGGVGATHQLNSTHETKYMYGTPQQEEITRLFGSQVGYWVHYKKDMTVDPNGQVSVTYKNMGDKVIATTLAGSGPLNLNGLPGAQNKQIHSDLFAADSIGNELSTDHLKKTYNSKFTVAEDNKYAFDYSAILGAYQLSCLKPDTTNSSLILDGAVNLTIQLKDGCGSVVFSKNNATPAGHSGSIRTMSYDTTEVNLKQGEYILSKQISIDEQKLEKYWQDYLADSTNNCLKKENTFITEERNQLDLVGCELTCEKCQIEAEKLLADSVQQNYTAEQMAEIRSMCDELCDKEVGCSNYIYSMQGDMSPGGQYGELRKPKFNTPKQPEPVLDSNGQPQISDTDIVLNSKDDDGVFDAGNSDEDFVNPQLFPLSVFNEYNSLPLNKWISGVPATWRYPLQITDGDYTGDNWNNQVLFVKNGLGNASYSVTDYKDETGAIVYAYIFRIAGTSTFKPAISDTTQKTLEDAKTQLYKIPIKYLLNIADFEKYWQQQFANYLIPYHPEYGYLVDCTDHYIESNNFDYKLSSTASLAEAAGNQYLDTNSYSVIIIGSSRSTSVDPYIKNSNPNFNYIKSRNDTYVSGKTMSQMATIAVNCPRANETGACSVPSDCANGRIDTDDEWNVYKGLYVAEKQKLIKTQATKEAVYNYYYNGCIGEENFYTTPDAQVFRDARYAPQPSSNYYSQCNTVWSNANNFTWNCATVAAIQTAVPYLDSRQVCYTDRAPLFKDKTKRFFIAPSSTGPGGQIPANCQSAFIGPDTTGSSQTDTALVAVPCDSAITQFTDEMVAEAHRFKYESCGLCPLAADVESFIMGISAAKLMHKDTTVHVTCQNDSVEVGEELRRRLVNLNTAQSADIKWFSKLTNNKRTLYGRFMYGTDTIARIKLVIPDSIPSFVKFDSLVSLCCMTVNSSTSNPDLGKTFSLHAAYDSLPRAYIPGRKRKKMVVTGTFDLRLDTCIITPRCKVTEDAKITANLLNMLTLVTIDKANDLITSSADVTLLTGQPIRKKSYMEAVRQMVKMDNLLEQDGYATDSQLEGLHPKWNSDIISGGTLLQATFSYDGGNYIVIRITGLTTALDYGKITEFTRLRPFAGNNRKFYVDALIVDGSQKQYKTLIIETPALKPTVCQEPKPPVAD